ncbi:MAG: hypothetical protein ACJAR3_001852, partial [Roseivirga sp.]
MHLIYEIQEMDIKGEARNTHYLRRNR